MSATLLMEARRELGRLPPVLDALLTGLDPAGARTRPAAGVEPLELMLEPNVMMLDTGCVWGGPLTAIRLDDRRVFQVPSRSAIAPKPFG